MGKETNTHLSSPSGVNNYRSSSLGSSKSKMKIQTSGGEGPLTRMAVCALREGRREGGREGGLVGEAQANEYSGARGGEGPLTRML